MTESDSTPSSTLDWLQRVARDILGIMPERLNKTSSLADLGIDSLAQLQLIILAEKELGASIPDAALTEGNLRSLQTLAATIDTCRS